MLVLGELGLGGLSAGGEGDEARRAPVVACVPVLTTRLLEHPRTPHHAPPFPAASNLACVLRDTGNLKDAAILFQGVLSEQTKVGELGECADFSCPRV